MSDKVAHPVEAFEPFAVAPPIAVSRFARLRHSPAPMAAALVAVDTIALVICLMAGFWLYGFVKPEIILYRSAIATYALGGIFIFYALGLYPGIGRTTVEELRRTSYASTLTHLFLMGSMFLAKTMWADSRGGVLISWALSQLAVPAARALLRHSFYKVGMWGIPVVVLGAGKTAQKVIDNLRDTPGLGYWPLVCLDDDMDKRGVCNGVPVVGCLDDAAEVAEKYNIRCAIVAMPGIQRRTMTGIVEDLSKTFPSVILVPDLFGIATLWTQPQDLGGVLGLKICANRLSPTSRVLKRTLDIVAASIGMIVTAPLMLGAMVWIKATSKGPAVYLQMREGKGGRLIAVRKLRTMYEDAEARLERYLADNPAALEEWRRYFKLKDDPRVLPGVGRLLRRSSLDELPQLWNILVGEMSLVGPRPFPEYHNAHFEPRTRQLRLAAAPGLTGLWQITARSDGDLDVQAALDSYYIRNWSMWLDLYILVRTAAVVWRGTGAY
jgi:Undecaprenyl-phosphate galactose phosphotransferase WbaP